MRAVVQRVTSSRVEVDQEIVGQIESGLLVLVGVEDGDTAKDLGYIRDKVIGLRVFPDDAGLMNRSVIDSAGSILLVSQFTLLGDVRKGRRPSFIAAAEPECARKMCVDLECQLRELGATVETGQFQADMQVHLVNDGPVTILLDSRKRV